MGLNLMRCTDLLVASWHNNTILIEVKGAFGIFEMKLPLSRDQFLQSLARWDAGMLIQNAFPTLNAEQRECLKTGMPPLVQEEVFSEGDE